MKPGAFRRRPSRGGAPTVRLAAGAMLAGMVAIAAPAAPGSAQPTEAPLAPVARLVVTALPRVIGPGSATEEGTDADADDASIRMLVENVSAVPIDSLRLVVEVHRRAGSRGALRAAMDRDLAVGGHVHVADQPLADGDELRPGDLTAVTVTLRGGQAGWSSGGGVYPVTLSVVRGTEVLDRVTTAVIRLAEQPRSPLNAVVVWPIDTRPWRLRDGRFPPNVGQELAPNGRLDRLVTALERVPRAGVLVSVAPHLLEDLEDRAGGFEVIQGDQTFEVGPESPAATRANTMLQRIRSAATALPHDPIAAAYADADLGALARDGSELRSLGSSAAGTVLGRTTTLLGRQPDGGVHIAWVPLGLDGLELIGTSLVIVPYTAVEGPDPARDPDLPSPIQSMSTPSGRRMTLAVADPYLSAQLASPDQTHGPLITAQRILAETAMVHFQAPGRPDRPLVIVPPRDLDLPGDGAVQLLAGLTSASWLELVTPSAQVAAADPGLAAVVDPERDFDDGLVDDLVAALRRVEALEAALVTGETRIPAPADLMDDLVRSTTTWPGVTDGARRRTVAGVANAADEIFGTIEVAAGTGVTLTSEQGTVPVTVSRPDGAPLRVVVTLESQGRLSWPNGNRSEEVVLTAGAAQTLSFATVARSRGTFPVAVLVTDPTGQIVLHEATVTVRSTAVSGPALVILGGVVVLLLLIGLIRRRRPGRRVRHLAVVQDLGGQDKPPSPAMRS